MVGVVAPSRDRICLAKEYFQRRIEKTSIEQLLDHDSFTRETVFQRAIEKMN